MEENNEVMSAITSDIQGFLLDMGAEAGTYEYDHTVKGGRAYIVEIRFIGEDAGDLANEIADNIYELQEHLRTAYPEVKVLMTLTTAYDEFLVEDEDEIEDLVAEICDTVDEEDADTVDSLDRQYEEEGLHIVHEDDEDLDYIEELGDEDDDDLDFETPHKRCRRKEDSDDSFYEEETEEEYIPSDEDREELWRMFGGGEDE